MTKINESKADAIRRLSATGQSTRAIAEAVGVSHSAVARYLARSQAGSGVAAAPPLPEPPAAAESVPAVDLESIDAIGTARELVLELKQQIESDRTIGNSRSVNASMRVLGAILPLIARLEKAEASRGDGMWVTRDELHEAQLRVRSIAGAVLERPMLCAHCGRQLSAVLGGLPADGAEVSHD